MELEIKEKESIAEVLEILGYMEDEEVNKIPFEIINKITVKISLESNSFKQLFEKKQFVTKGQYREKNNKVGY